MKQLIAAGWLLLATTLFAQPVVTVPEFATENDSIKIIFDATQGGGGMAGYTGTLYTHTGVITNLSGGQWAHVIGSWGNNSTQPSLTRIGTDLYELVIGFPRQFYSVTNPNEHIEQLAFVFRSASATQQTEDLFAVIYQPGLSVVMIEPQVSVPFGIPERSPAFVSPGDTLRIAATAAQIGVQLSSITLSVAGTQVAQTTSDTLMYDFIADNFGQGMTTVSVIAAATSGSADTASFKVMVNPPQVLANPPAGVEPGINYNNSTSVTLALFAPEKEFVYVIGDFGDWMVLPNRFMNKYEAGPDSVLWWLTIDGLTPGVEYAFQYLVDGDLRIADPYTDKVLDPWNDPYIPSITYPNLKPYPNGKTAEPTSVFQTNQTPYVWQHSAGYQRPVQEALVIYEMLLRDFIHRHDYQTLIDTLDYLENLGVNAIELMPFNEFEGNSSWGYNPSFYFAPDKYYGTKNALKTFIDECHSRNIAVIMDMVLNHSYGQSPLVRLYWNSQLNRPAANNPWYNEVSPNPVYAWGSDFNHESIHTQAFVDRVNRYWLTEYQVDGFRFDFTKGFTNTPGDGGAFDQARINILKRMSDEIWAVDGSAYVILEHFTDNTEEKVLAEYQNGMMIWGNLNYNYNEATMGYHDNGKSNFSWGYYGNRGWTKANLVTYMESHDEERLMYKNLEFGNSSGSYNIKDLETALQRIKLAGAFFFTYPGPKMVWQFGELGYDISIDDPCRVCEKPILWQYFDATERHKLYKTFQALLKLRRENAPFHSPSSFVSMDLSDPQGRKRIGIIHPDMRVVILGNFGVTTQSFNPSFYNTGTWYDYFSGDSIEVANVNDQLTLGPGVFHIFTDVRLPAPEPGLVTGIVENRAPGLTPADFALHANYPNPFNPETTIEFDVARAGKVKLAVYNVLGQQIRILSNSQLNPGSYRVKWDGTNDSGEAVSSGIYFLRMSAGSFTQHRRMLLMK